MKDYLYLHKWWNLPPKNPTQTMYTRFMESPKSELKSAFTESVDDFNNFINKRTRTAYTSYLEDEKND